MLRQLSIKVNKAMAFYVKELLLTGTLTRCNWPSLVDQISVIGTDMDVNPANASGDPGVFAKCR